MPVSLAAGIAETAVSQLTGRHTEDAIGRLRVGRAPRQERATGASAIYAEQGARATQEGVHESRRSAAAAYHGLGVNRVTSLLAVTVWSQTAYVDLRQSKPGC